LPFVKQVPFDESLKKLGPPGNLLTFREFMRYDEFEIKERKLI
jgi:hypothetical protein